LIAHFRRKQSSRFALSFILTAEFPATLAAPYVAQISQETAVMRQMSLNYRGFRRLFSETFKRLPHILIPKGDRASHGYKAREKVQHAYSLYCE